MVDSHTVEAKASFFTRCAIWPIASEIDTARWLGNFKPEEKKVAYALLDGFMYFSSELTEKILSSTFHSMSQIIGPIGTPIQDRIDNWGAFLKSVLVTYPVDERPSAVDSGRAYMRKALKLLPLGRHQYVDPGDALAAIIQDSSRPIVFIDDFVGTGSQFYKTWVRNFEVAGRPATFAGTVKNGKAYYLPILATDMAAKNLNKRTPEVQLVPGHMLAEEYSAFHPNSLLWPKHLRSQAVDVIKEASARAGIPLGSGEAPNDWCGFGGLGLAVALDDTIPDASLSLLYWESNGWRPLIRRP